ncbi:hypothetical protein BKA61DRAFT_661588 [Leptodontidium sp. MPI-SDFR-AT-0119]|nr:hypothetical protein BKA61DRAFT_661588 [Leptodontidium sp. MPI-SDFR-AT-0119]
MRLSIILLWLSAALEVLGLASSAPFELLWLYPLMLEYFGQRFVSPNIMSRVLVVLELWPLVAPIINPSIPGQNPADEAKFVADALAAGLAGICSFDEFVKHIGKSASFSLYQYDSVGHQLIKKAVVQSHVYEFAPTKIFPGHDFGTIFPIPHAPFIDLATDTFQLIRASAPNDAFVKSEVEKSQYWVRIANGYGAADNKVLGIPTDKEPKGHFLTNYSTVNFKTTMSGSKKYPVITTQDQKDQLRSLVENYSTSNDKAIIHQDVMAYVEA